MNWRTTPKVPSSLPLAPEFLPFFRPGSRVLDIGCGEAAVGEPVAARGARYFGLDVNLPSLSQASSRFPVAAGEGESLPFRNHTFDLVMLRAVLTVLTDDRDLLAVLREAFRVSGKIIGIQDFLRTPEQPLYAARYREGATLQKPPGVFPVRQGAAVLYWARHFSPEELESLVNRAGGRVVSLTKTPSPTRSGNLIRGVTLLASPHDDLERAGP